MPANISNNFPELLPGHPHRRMHILLSILAFVLVVGSVVFYQTRKVKDLAVPDARDPSGLTEEQRAQIIEDFSKVTADIPPLTDSQRKKIIEDFNKEIAKQKK